MNPTEQATDWLIRAREGELTLGERQQLASWLAESPANVREYLETGELWVELQFPGLSASESKQDLIELMRSYENSNIFDLQGNARKVVEPTSASGSAAIARIPRFVTVLALAASLTAIVVVGWVYLNARFNVYKTARGEQRSLVLSDGSVVQLNTLSTLIVRFDKQRRHVELTQGEAYFRVAQDQIRPFEVKTPYARVRALGTAFDVYTKVESTRVAVTEGKVSVDSSSAMRVPGASVLNSKSPGSNRDAVVLLAAGQQLTVSHTAQPKAVAAKLQNATAWIQRRIVLDNDTVATAVTEFNRYNKSQIRVENAELAALRINGVFNADDPRALVKFLRDVQGVNSKETDDVIVLQP